MGNSMALATLPTPRKRVEGRSEAILNKLEATPGRLRRFVASVEKSAGRDGCWIWTGALNSDGYGSYMDGIPVHRVAYRWFVGPVGEGFEIDHLCRNRACVNPHHMEPVTRTENMRRSRERGPASFHDYCRNGHAMTPANVRLWRGAGGLRATCYACHRARASRRVWANGGNGRVA